MLHFLSSQPKTNSAYLCQKHVVFEIHITLQVEPNGQTLKLLAYMFVLSYRFLEKVVAPESMHRKLSCEYEKAYAVSNTLRGKSQMFPALLSL